MRMPNMVQTDPSQEWASLVVIPLPVYIHSKPAGLHSDTVPLSECQTLVCHNFRFFL